MAEVTAEPPRPDSAWLEIIVPAFNEAARLPPGLVALCEKAMTLPSGVEILVVDSASTDATTQIVEQWPDGPVPVRLLRCPRRGKGAAIQAGLLATSAPMVGFCDADMATDLSALDAAVELLELGHRMVIGSRAHPQSRVEARHSVFRRIGAAGFRRIARVIVPGVTDSQCGFKFFSGPVARSVAPALRTAGFAFDIELIARCQRLGVEPTQIPVRWHDVPGSTFSVLRHSVATFVSVGAIWISLRADAAHSTQPERSTADNPMPEPLAAIVLGGTEVASLP